MNINFFLLIVFFFWGGLSIGLAQRNHFLQSHELNLEDGLMGHVHSIKEDSRGLIWIASDNGLKRYDGLDLYSYTKKDYPLAGDNISGIAEDEHGNIWAFTRTQFGEAVNGISIVEPKKRSVKKIQDYCTIPVDFDISQLYSIQRNSDGSIWMLTEEYELWEYQGNQIRFLTKIDVDRIFQVVKIDERHLALSIAQDTTHYYQIIDHKTNKKTVEQRYQRPSGVYLKPSVSNKKNYGVVVKDKGVQGIEVAFWVANTNRQQILKKINLGQKKLKGYFWSKDALLLYFGNKIAYYNVRGELLEQIEVQLKWKRESIKYIDAHHGIWAFEKGKLSYSRFALSKFSAHRLTDSTGRFYRGGRGMVLDQDSILYLGSVMPFENTQTNDGLSIVSLRQACFGVSKATDGNLWLALDGGFLGAFDLKKNVLKEYPFLKHPKGIHWSVLEDASGKVWIGSNAGLRYLDKEKQEVFPCENYNGFSSLEQSTINYIYEKGNLLWLATSTGLYQWHKEKGALKHFHNKGELGLHLPHDIIAHIHEDKDGLFWLASKGGGLIQLDTETGSYEQYNRNKGLTNDVLYAVYEDDDNGLWMSSNWGIMRFDKKEKTVDSYTQDNGLIDNEFNTSSHYKDVKGHIYFGSQEGLVYFNPKDFKEKHEDFTLEVSQLSKLSREKDEYYSVLTEWHQNQVLVISPEDKGFELQIALLDYRNPKTHRYAYKIEGVDKNWHYQSNPNIRENNLPYGNFTILVKVRGFSGKWVDLKQPIKLSVLYPFYLKWWFISGALISLFLSIYSLIRWRTSQLRARKNELEKTVAKRTAKIAEQTEELKALDKVKSRFFANISHELRTPLTLILGPISEISNKPRGLFDEKKVRESLAVMERNGENLLKLIEEILDLSKLEANKISLEEEKVHVSSFLKEIFELFQVQATYLGVDLKMKNKLPSDLYLLLDANKLAKILNNLLSNALKFTPTSKTIEFKILDQGETIEFIVQDEGQGIHPNDLPHIFERFYQSRQPDKIASGGTGIGLALVHEFVKLMEGNVQVSSNLNKGSTFRVLIPKKIIYVAQEEHEALLQRLKYQQEEKGNLPIWQAVKKEKTILIVEDHAEMRDFIASLLDNNYTILTATNGLKGLEILEQKALDIDLIISDIMMPEMDGFTMLEKIKCHETWASIPMIMLTARAAEYDKLNALTIGVDDYLTKPFSTEELRVRVANLLRNAQERKKWAKENVELTLPDSVVNKLEQQENTKTEDLKWVKKVEKLIHSKMGMSNIQTDALAKELHISKRHLERRLKKVTGLTPAKFIKEMRLKMALHLIETKQCSNVSELSFTVGFQTTNTFSKSFKERFGKLPREYFDAY